MWKSTTNFQHLTSNKSQHCSLVIISQTLRQTRLRFQTDSITSFLELRQLLCSDSKSVCIPTWKVKSDDLCIFNIILLTPWSSVPDTVYINLSQASTGHSFRCLVTVLVIITMTSIRKIIQVNFCNDRECNQSANILQPWSRVRHKFCVHKVYYYVHALEISIFLAPYSL